MEVLIVLIFTKNISYIISVIIIIEYNIISYYTGVYSGKFHSGVTL